MPEDPPDIPPLSMKAPRGLKTVYVAVEPPRLVRVEVDGALKIEDAKTPHFEWDWEEGEEKASEPALVLHGEKLKLKAKFQGGSRKMGKIRVACALRLRQGEAPVATLEKEIDTDSVGDTFDATFETSGPFTEAIAVFPLGMDWHVLMGEKKNPIEPKDKVLRLYTAHRKPVKNSRNSGPNASKAHLEHACAWAREATKNVGQGKESIAWNVDNMMRHYVHPKDMVEGNPDYASVYGESDPPPLNYGDLPGWVSNGQRNVSSLYYPPLKPKKPYEEYYPHYQNNFGWKVLDNKTHPGGRCNQQASLVADILGTLGIDASVLYLERKGFGKKTRRPVFQRFYSADGGGPWNFHGICKTRLDDGTFHMYDGSFSSPPNRKNGSEEWAIGDYGPFIKTWAYWEYSDSGAKVPEDDVPTTWNGVPEGKKT